MGEGEEGGLDQSGQLVVLTAPLDRRAGNLFNQRLNLRSKGDPDGDHYQT